MVLSSPPLDADGTVKPHDHEEIGPRDGIIRRISEKQLVIDKNGSRRISSMAYRPSSGPNGAMSIDLEQSIVEAGFVPQEFVTTPYWIGSVRFEASAIRITGFQIGYDPTIDNPHHGAVWGEFSRVQIARLQNLAVWFVEIPGAVTAPA